MKKDYLSPDFELITIRISGNIMGSEPEGQIHENAPGEEIKD